MPSREELQALAVEKIVAAATVTTSTAAKPPLVEAAVQNLRSLWQADVQAYAQALIKALNKGTLSLYALAEGANAFPLDDVKAADPDSVALAYELMEALGWDDDHGPPSKEAMLKQIRSLVETAKIQGSGTDPLPDFVRSALDWADGELSDEEGELNGTFSYRHELANSALDTLCAEKERLLALVRDLADFASLALPNLDLDAKLKEDIGDLLTKVKDLEP